MSYKRLLSRLERFINQSSTEERKDIVNKIIRENGIFIPQPDNTVDIILKDEIVYIEQPKTGIVFIQSLESKIEYNNKSCDILEYAAENFEGFMLLNHSVVVNTDKMINYDSYLRKVYFVNDHEVMVTKAAIDNIVQKLLGKCKDLREDTFFGNSSYGF